MKEIIIQGTPRPIHFGLRAIDEFAKQRGAEFGQAVASTDALGSLDSIVSLTATGLNEGARRAGDDSRYTEDEVWDIFDEITEGCYNGSVAHYDELSQDIIS